MLTVTKIVEFEAAHRLPNHKGKCHHIHGHSYCLEITIGNKNDHVNADGMIMDFGDLKQIIMKMVDDYFDHHLINDWFPANPTAENMVLWIRDNLSSMLPHSSNEIQAIRLWETSTSHADWRKN